MDASVRSQGPLVEKVEGPTLEIRDLPPRLLYDERTGGHVPRLELEFPEAAKRPAGYITEVQGSRAAAADSLGTDDEGIELPNIVEAARPDVIWETRGQKGFPKLGDIRNLDRAAVPESPASPNGLKEL